MPKELQGQGTVIGTCVLVTVCMRDDLNMFITVRAALYKSLRPVAQLEG